MDWFNLIMKKIIILIFTLILCSHNFAIAQSMQDLMKKAKKLSYEGQMNRAEELMGQKMPDSSGKESPSADSGMTFMFIMMVWGSVGTGYFIYGKKTSKFVFLLCGIGLCVFPIFITNNTINIILGIVMIILPFKIDG